MRTLAISTACCLLAASISAQTTSAELRTATQFGNFARDGAGIHLQTRAAGSLIAKQDNIGALQGNAFADSILGWNVWPGGIVTADVSEQGGGDASSGPIVSGTTSSASAANLVPGPHELRLTLRGAPLLEGKIEVWASGLARAGSNVILAADIGDDQSTDFSLTVPGTERATYLAQQWRVRFDANGNFAVRIMTEARATTATSTVYKTGISVRFTPGSFCAIEPYGQSCGPVLTGRDAVKGATRQITTLVGDAVANAPGILIIGGTRLALPLPGTQCFLNTDVIVALPIATTQFGSGEWTLTAPLNLSFVANCQALLFSATLQPTSSNAITITCP